MKEKDLEAFAQSEKLDASTTMAHKLAMMRLHKPNMTQTEAVARIISTAEPEGAKSRRRFTRYVQRRVAELWDVPVATN
jgi:hypothetical protein